MKKQSISELAVMFREHYQKQNNMKVIKSVKQAFESDNVIITKIMQGRGQVRIDARTRHHVADADNFFSQWVSFKYADRLCRERYGKPITQHRNFQY